MCLWNYNTAAPITVKTTIVTPAAIVPAILNTAGRGDVREKRVSGMLRRSSVSQNVFTGNLPIPDIL
jgi:hypothetical protein